MITDGLKGHEDVLAENSTKLSLGFAGLDHWSYFSCRTEEHRSSPLLVGGHIWGWGSQVLGTVTLCLNFLLINDAEQAEGVIPEMRKEYKNAALTHLETTQNGQAHGDGKGCHLWRDGHAGEPSS